MTVVTNCRQIQYRTNLPKTRKASALDLAQCAASADECDRANRGDGGENLEEVPGSIVQEEDSLEPDKRSEEHGVRERSRFERGREMADIGAEEKPLIEDQSDSAQQVL